MEHSAQSATSDKQSSVTVHNVNRQKVNAVTFDTASPLSKLIQDLHQGQATGEISRTKSVRMSKRMLQPVVQKTAPVETSSEQQAVTAFLQQGDGQVNSSVKVITSPVVEAVQPDVVSAVSEPPVPSSTKPKIEIMQPRPDDLPLEHALLVHAQLKSSIEQLKGDIRDIQEEDEKVEQFSKENNRKQRKSFAEFLGKKKEVQPADSTLQVETSGVKRSKSLLARAFQKFSPTSTSSPVQTEVKSEGAGAKLLRGLSLRSSSSKSRPSSVANELKPQKSQEQLDSKEQATQAMQKILGKEAPKPFLPGPPSAPPTEDRPASKKSQRKSSVDFAAPDAIQEEATTPLASLGEEPEVPAATKPALRDSYFLVEPRHQSTSTRPESVNALLDSYQADNQVEQKNNLLSESETKMLAKLGFAGLAEMLVEETTVLTPKDERVFAEEVSQRFVVPQEPQLQGIAEVSSKNSVVLAAAAPIAQVQVDILAEVQEQKPALEVQEQPVVKVIEPEPPADVSVLKVVLSEESQKEFELPHSPQITDTTTMSDEIVSEEIAYFKTDVMTGVVTEIDDPSMLIEISEMYFVGSAHMLAATEEIPYVKPELDSFVEAEPVLTPAEVVQISETVTVQEPAVVHQLEVAQEQVAVEDPVVVQEPSIISESVVGYVPALLQETVVVNFAVEEQVEEVPPTRAIEELDAVLQTLQAEDDTEVDYVQLLQDVVDIESKLHLEIQEPVELTPLTILEPVDQEATVQDISPSEVISQPTELVSEPQQHVVAPALPLEQSSESDLVEQQISVEQSTAQIEPVITAQSEPSYELPKSNPEPEVIQTVEPEASIVIQKQEQEHHEVAVEALELAYETLVVSSNKSEAPVETKPAQDQPAIENAVQPAVSSAVVLDMNLASTPENGKIQDFIEFNMAPQSQPVSVRLSEDKPAEPLLEKSDSKPEIKSQVSDQPKISHPKPALPVLKPKPKLPESLPSKSEKSLASDEPPKLAPKPVNFAPGVSLKRNTSLKVSQKVESIMSKDQPKNSSEVQSAKGIDALAKSKLVSKFSAMFEQKSVDAQSQQQYVSKGSLQDLSGSQQNLSATPRLTAVGTSGATPTPHQAPQIIAPKPVFVPKSSNLAK